MFELSDPEDDEQRRLGRSVGRQLGGVTLAVLATIVLIVLVVGAAVYGLIALIVTMWARG